MALTITFLGTGTSQGVPVISCECEVCSSADEKDKRLRSSILIEGMDTHVVIDSGPDFRQQMLRANVKELDAVVFTHEHKDHIAGLDDVRAFNYKYQKAFDVYAEERVQKTLKKEYAYVFEEEKYPGVPDIKLHDIENLPFTIKDLKFTPVRGLHYKLPVFGFRVGNFAYVTDVNYIPDEEMLKLTNLDVLVITALRKEKHISHFNLEEALEVISQLNPKKAYLNHISHLMGKYQEVNSLLPNNIELAYDGLVVQSS